MSEKQKLGPRQKKLVNALRSGKYNQSRNALQVYESYCCLGVACIVSEQKMNKYSNGRLTGITLKDQPGVQELYRFKTATGSFFDNENRDKEIVIDGIGYYDLVSVNDKGHSFTVIAQIIEDNPELIFEEPV